MFRPHRLSRIALAAALTAGTLAGLPAVPAAAAETLPSPLGLNISCPSPCTTTFVAYWQPVPGATSYAVEYSGPVSNAVQTTATSLRHTDLNLRPGRYRFKVMAFKGELESAFSSEKLVLIGVNPPSRVTSSMLGARNAVVTWSPRSSVSSYRVRVIGGGTVRTFAADRDVRNYNVTFPKAGAYQVCVASVFSTVVSTYRCSNAAAS